jgi:hypothetical protein
MTYDAFKAKIAKVLREAPAPLTWTEIRTIASLPQAFPNNQWVRRMEADIGLTRRRESNGIIRWQLKESLFDPPIEASDQVRPREGGKQGAME